MFSLLIRYWSAVWPVGPTVSQSTAIKHMYMHLMPRIITMYTNVFTISTNVSAMTSQPSGNGAKTVTRPHNMTQNLITEAIPLCLKYLCLGPPPLPSIHMCRFEVKSLNLQ